MKMATGGRCRLCKQMFGHVRQIRARDERDDDSDASDDAKDAADSKDEDVKMTEGDDAKGR